MTGWVKIDVLLGIAAQFAPLHRAAGGQDDVGVSGSVGSEQVDIHDEVELLDGFQEARGVREHAVVEPEAHEAAQGVRVAGVDVPGKVHRLSLIDHLCPHREALGAHARREVAPRAGHLELAVAGHEPAPRLQPTDRLHHVAPGYVPVAGEPHQRGGRPLVLHAVGVVHYGGRTRHHAGRFSGGIEPGRLADERRRHPVICSARSGVNSAAYALNSSKPWVHSDTNCRS